MLSRILVKERRRQLLPCGHVALAAGASDENLLPVLIEAAEAHVSEGEIVQALQEVWGSYQETPVF